MSAFVQREVACAECGSLLYVMVPTDAAGTDRCACPNCHADLAFTYDEPDPMLGLVAVADEPEAPF